MLTPVAPSTWNIKLDRFERAMEEFKEFVALGAAMCRPVSKATLEADPAASPPRLIRS
jgi:hypothetical protein